MPKKQKESVSSEEDISQANSSEEESYGSEDDASMQEQGAPEVDRANILNYESDDSSDDVAGMEEDSDESELDTKMRQQKESLRMNDTWGKTKKSYYKNADESDKDSSEGEEDQLKEAERLQNIRR